MMNSNILKFPKQATITAEQFLVIRCHYFANEGEVKAYCEGIGCPYGDYLELKQRYQVGLDELATMDRQAQINQLTDWGFESAIVENARMSD